MGGMKPAIPKSDLRITTQTHSLVLSLMMSRSPVTLPLVTTTPSGARNRQ